MSEINLELEQAVDEEAKALSQRIDLSNHTDVLNYGGKIQHKLANLAKNVAGGAKQSDVDTMNAALINLDAALKRAQSIIDERNTPSPIKRLRKMLAKREPAMDDLRQCKKELEGRRMALVTSLKMLEAQRRQNAELIEKLKKYIAAGRLKLQATDGALYALQQETLLTSITKDFVQTEAGQIMLEQRLQNLTATQVFAEQADMQMRLTIQTHQKLIEAAQASILNAAEVLRNSES